MHIARAALIREVVALWAERCHQYNKAYWAALHDLVISAAAEVCDGKDEVQDMVWWALSSVMLSDFSNALRRLMVPLQDEIAMFIDSRIRAEQAPREHVNTFGDFPTDDMAGAIEQYIQQFEATYPAVELPRDAGAIVPDFPPPDTPPAQWSNKYVPVILKFMAETQWHLHEAIKRLKAIVGPEPPVVAHARFLPNVTATLRDALHLNDVQAVVHKRAHALCEPDEDVVARRDAVKKRRLALEELRLVVEQLSSVRPADSRDVLDTHGM